MSVKRPILAFSSLNSDVEDIINNTNSGKVFDYSNKVDLKNHILDLYKKFKAQDKSSNLYGIDQYSYSSLSKRLREIIYNTIN